MSPEALLIDNEISGYLLRYKQGFAVTPETLATDLIKKVGLSGDFISTDHTLEYFRTELSRGDLAVRTQRSQWEADGKKTIEAAAQERLSQLLAAEPAIYLDQAQERELERLEQAGLAELDQ